MATILATLPPESHLQLGNSMAVRYANYLGRSATVRRIDSNRGTSGIDGTLSTAVGAALGTSHLTTFISGDLGFFYDRNGLWHNHLPQNLRIILLNNHGGGIFQLIDGPNQLAQPVRQTYFDTPHPLNARHTAKDYDCAYFHSHDQKDLEAALPQFFAPETGPAILEIETDMAQNTAIFYQFKALIAK